MENSLKFYGDLEDFEIKALEPCYKIVRCLLSDMVDKDTKNIVYLANFLSDNTGECLYDNLVELRDTVNDGLAVLEHHGVPDMKGDGDNGM